MDAPLEARTKFLSVVFLSVLLALTLLADFHHTEKTLKRDPLCPSCHFQNSSISLTTIDFFCHPELDFLEFVQVTDVLVAKGFTSLCRSPRGPPRA